MDTSALPTKNNLMRLKDKIKLSEQGHELLEKKKFILTVEENKFKERKQELEQELFELMQQGNAKLKNASIDVGIDELIDISEEIKIEDSISIKDKTIMGVEIPSIVSQKEDIKLNYGLYGTTVSIDESIIIFNQIKDKIIQLAEVENTIYRLRRSINKVQTRSNALKDIIIPNDKKGAHEISDILEERDREEFTRLKVIKNR